MGFAIETTRLTRDFGTFRAVDGLDLRIESGCFYGFLGPNGAGKSTTIKMLTGLLSPSSGGIRILGEDISAPAKAIFVKRRVGVVPENLALYDNLTALSADLRQLVADFRQDPKKYLRIKLTIF